MFTTSYNKVSNTLQDYGITSLQDPSQPAFTCSKLTMETLNKVWNMFQVNNKDT